MIALDTSFLLAAEGRDAMDKWRRATALLSTLDAAEIVVPAQAMAEMLHVLKTIHAVPESEAGIIAARWLAATRSAGISRLAIDAALDLSQSASVSLEDALIVTVSEEAGATLLLSDEIPDGMTYGMLSIANPFAAGAQPRLAAMLGAGWAGAI